MNVSSVYTAHELFNKLYNSKSRQFVKKRKKKVNVLDDYTNFFYKFKLPLHFFSRLIFIKFQLEVQYIIR